MNHAEIARTYSFETLQCIVRDLSRTGAWFERMSACRRELENRKAELKS